MKPFKRKPLVIAVLAVVIAAGAGIALMAPKNEAPARTAAATVKPALTVSVVRPQQQPLPIRLAANGNIMAWQEASIGSESNGLRLAEVRVNVGDSVRAGEVLAIFAREAVEADVAQARAALMEAEALAADAAANAARARTLDASGALSAQQIAQYQTSEQTARARVQAARATLAAQQLRLRHVQVLAPDSGVISERKATVGAVVPAGTELFRLIRKGRLEWRAEVTATELGRIKAGTPATLVAANGTRLQGKVRMIGPTVDPQSRSALVYVDLQPAAADAAPASAGMFARGEFDLGSSPALTVPQQAVVLRDGFSYVFRLGPDNRVTQLKVRPGRRIGDRVEILEGLPPDASVVASGAGFLNEGDTVRVVGDGNGGAAQAGTTAPRRQ
ncbi:efflux RND transporter periplasmic adaptor subunit [Noviherbaspirillum aridicola]|uniref:Secretion protein HlyD n=1 Tax=Noviherbaspirillum aridicola TaxID=2849687 RepID=A0ABQ4QAV4_9BURK|nr:efflux RND transporter periplasmic adaptor subunit [Noviherbaspirillum aridicola]GIZ53809.1 secretion protein HlyD [Noviherbaspirillum aridicola]